METRNIYQNISPLDQRCSVSEKALFDSLVPYLSEEASVRACALAEAALVTAHLEERGLLTPDIKAALFKAAHNVAPADVYREEEKTKHNIRALVNVFKRAVSGLPAAGGVDISPFVHLGATSVDILDTAQAYRIKGVTVEVVLPLLRKLETLLARFALAEAETPQIGRTHGQHAVPITLGFAFAEYVSRLGKSASLIEALSCQLKGKLAGATGSYNALRLISPDPLELERRYLAALGLEASEHSTQLVEPEYLLRLLLEFNTAFGIIANLADDLRNLQRSEIGELQEGFSQDQVGSSTMPQKRYPWNSEHVKSLWKAFCPRVLSFYMDQISEHQRDLTNSASARFIADYIAGFCMAIDRMVDVVSGLGVRRERLARNIAGLDSGGVPGGVMAEPAYILLAQAGEADAHEVIRKVTLAAEREGVSFAQALFREKEVAAKISVKRRELGLVQGDEDPEAAQCAALAFFENPERYRGLAAEKAKAIAEKYLKLME
jgi:adenylosuccinate lyase